MNSRAGIVDVRVEASPRALQRSETQRKPYYSRAFTITDALGPDRVKSHCPVVARSARASAISCCTALDGAASSSFAPAASASQVLAVLFDMDGVLCNSEIVSRKAAAEVMAELYGLDVSPEEFIPFTGTGEANFLGGVARKFGAPFEVESCKAKFFEIYMAKYAVPGAGIGYTGARELVEACRAAGLRTAVASSADLVKVHANLRAADIPLDIFDTIVSADVFERLKPFPDIFLAAASHLGVAPGNCVVIEDAIAGVEAARAAGMRVIGVTTTLDESEMQSAAPDCVLPVISAIDVERITNLKLRSGGAKAIALAKSKAQAHP